MIDVLEALLGVIYNVSHENDEAVNCLQSDVVMWPGDIQLWNELGAFHANSQQSQEAQQSHKNKLVIKPKYAWAC